MSRINRIELFMEMARLASRRSTCQRLAVGAVIVQNNNPISIGYNGAATGEPHCLGAHCPVLADGGCSKAIHAERNALERLRHDPGGGALTMFCTDSPCPECARLIGETEGISRFFFERPYRKVGGLFVLWQQGLETYQVTSSGYVNEISFDEAFEPGEKPKMRKVPVALDR